MKRDFWVLEAYWKKGNKFPTLFEIPYTEAACKRLEADLLAKGFEVVKFWNMG